MNLFPGLTYANHHVVFLSPPPPPNFQSTSSLSPKSPMDTQHLLQIPYSTICLRNFLSLSSCMSFPSALSDFLCFWETLQNHRGSGTVKGVFRMKTLEIGFGLCSSVPHPQGIETRITSSPGLFNLLQSQLECVQQCTTNLSWASYFGGFVCSLWKG